MPYVRFNGFDEGVFRQILPSIIDAVSEISDAPREKVKVELLGIKRLTETPLSIEILMFPRAQKTHDAIAAHLYNLVKLHGYTDVHIFFVMLAPSLYYRNGVPLNNISWLTGASGPENT